MDINEMLDEEAMSERHLYLLGRKAYPSSNNPYEPDTKEHTLWQMGWSTSRYLQMTRQDQS